MNVFPFYFWEDTRTSLSFKCKDVSVFLTFVDLSHSSPVQSLTWSYGRNDDGVTGSLMDYIHIQPDSKQLPRCSLVKYVGLELKGTVKYKLLSSL